MSDLYQIRLVVDRAGEGYTARWINSGGPESEAFPLVLPLTEEDAAELRWYLETYIQFPGAGDHARARGSRRGCKAWGQALFDAMFGSRRRHQRLPQPDGRGQTPASPAC